MLKNKILPTVVLVTICVVVAILLSVTNSFTSSVIENAQAEKVNEALRVVYPAGESFLPLDIEGKDLPETVTEAYSVNDGGYVFKATVKGYKDGLVILVGIDASGAVTQTKYVESNETNGAEKSLDGAYNGITEGTLTPEIISGSTKTSNAYHTAVKDAFSAFNTLKGGAAK